ncbi:hypothetical protein [Gordonia rhizosphera]|uniref:Head-to-tail adaptor n=1 Tax=Gordonia rhizosphera NBRC 16068 TaxID=1108045 RepID=K6WHA1_9ACTN|nr:hypothetical protein [Gordonia rhizosphera]GAB93161.1 hypothetical protein GORHZ_207_00100 [Gordonia rhizosphera NBRC 16068]
MTNLPSAPITFTNDILPFDNEMTETEGTLLIQTVWARVLFNIAPCLAVDDITTVCGPAELVVLKSILRDAVLRLYERGSGIVKSETSGDFSRSFVNSVGVVFRPQEIEDLQSLCGSASSAQRASTAVTWGPYWEQDADGNLVPVDTTAGVHPFILGY